MADRSTDGDLSFTIHGLNVDDGKVRAEVFLTEFRAILNSLQIGDKFLNGNKKAHDYLIVELKAASAHALLRERVSVKKRIPASSIPFVREAMTCVYNGDTNIERFPKEMIEEIEVVAKRAGQKFSHGEVAFGGNNVVRIDDYLAKQATKAIQRLDGDTTRRYFEGISLGRLMALSKKWMRAASSLEVSCC